MAEQLLQQTRQLRSNRMALGSRSAGTNVLADNRQTVPIQRMNWTYNGAKWVPDSWVGANPSNAPKNKPPEGTTYNDVTNKFTAPVQEQAPEVEVSAHKLEKIQPYLDLLNHMAAEQSGSSKPTGGHLLTAMQAKWGDKLELLNPGDKNNAAKWHARFKINGHEKNVGSTMFPANWTKADLEAQLKESNSIGSRIILMPSEIEIKKAGGTFYPK